jgi:hypothetical protein
MSYSQIYTGEWQQPPRKNFFLACCDCGLVHRLDFRIVKGHIQFRTFLHPRATAGIRQGMKRKKK